MPTILSNIELRKLNQPTKYTERTMKKIILAILFSALAFGCTSNPARPTHDKEQDAAMRELSLLRFERQR
jgi:hypothetical protein